MFAPGKGFLEIGAGGGDGESFIRLTELNFQAVRGEGRGRCCVGWREEERRAAYVCSCELSLLLLLLLPFSSSILGEILCVWPVLGLFLTCFCRGKAQSSCTYIGMYVHTYARERELPGRQKAARGGVLETPEVAARAATAFNPSLREQPATKRHACHAKWKEG